MKKIRINKPDLTRSAKAISSAFGIKHIDALDIICKGCGFKNYKEYKENLKEYPNTGSVCLPKFCDLEQINPIDLEDLSEKLKEALISETSNVVISAERYFPFLDKERQRKLERYKTSAGGYRARIYLGLFPYLYAYSTGRKPPFTKDEPEEVIASYAKSLISRYYAAPEEVQLLILNTIRFGAIPDAKVTMASNYNLLELFGYNQKPLDETCFETAVIRFIGEDISRNGDGSDLETFIKAELKDSDKRFPSKVDLSNRDQEGDMIEQLGFKKLIPTLAKARSYKAPSDFEVLTKRIKKELGISCHEYDINASPYVGLSSSYPLMLTEKDFMPDLLLSRADLLSGILIRGTTGSGSHEFMLIMLSQLMSTGGGFVYLNGNGHLGDFYKLYSYAYAMNRERDFVFISRLNAEHYSVKLLKQLIAENKLIYVYCGTMEKMPIGKSEDFIALVKRLTKATNQPRCNQGTPFTFASNSDTLRDPDLKSAMNRLDRVCTERRYGRMFNDYGEIFFLTKFYKERHYMFHALMHCESEKSCPHFAQRIKFHAGEVIVTMDGSPIREKTKLIYRSATGVETIILT